MLRAHCLNAGCTWTFESNDRAAMDRAREAHYDTHPWAWREDGIGMPRFSALIDDQVSVEAHPDLPALWGSPASGDLRVDLTTPLAMAPSLSPLLLEALVFPPGVAPAGFVSLVIVVGYEPPVAVVVWVDV